MTIEEFSQVCRPTLAVSIIYALIGAGTLEAQTTTVHQAPDPSAPLVDRWRWAFSEAEERGVITGFWIAWGIARPGHESDLIVSDAGGGPRYLPETELAPALGGHGSLDSDVILLFELPPAARDGGDIRYVRLRSTSLAISLGGEPLFWLGGSRDDESVAVLESLILATSDVDLQAKMGAAVALHVDITAALPAVRRLLRSSSDPYVRGEVASWLGHQSSDAAVAVLKRTAFTDTSERVRYEAITGLRGIGSEEASRALIELLEHADYVDVRREAAQSLGWAGNDAAIPALEAAVNDDADVDVQIEAVDALRSIGSPAAFQSLRRIAATHSDWDVRSEAAEAVARDDGA